MVTPHILTDDRILLDVDARRRSAAGVGVGLTINDEHARVKMITSNGETAVIGGMRQMQETKVESGIPILQDIPLIGQAFKYTKRENKKTDLIIFITPRILGSVSSQMSN
jgi:type IV pilus assembly protein PilQ